MPAKGKHRRPKTPRLSRSIAVAGTGGAALALPLLGATGAHAATPARPASGKAVRTLTGTVEKAAAPSASGVRGYTVRSGDCLATIAERRHVSGGWQRLYADNRRAVGADPSLIHPGLRLTLGEADAPAGTGSAAPHHAPAAPEPSAKPAPAAPKPAPA
ncbi:LysM domain-containing protein, partial [Streptomyces sp. NPDC029080]|uniref:LysM peptidoglycan-binding domain-containing protein n=1 Tax=Streptomyces sp. NPDC029080 TaxID=3155017 RepID=UPI0033CCB4C9